MRRAVALLAILAVAAISVVASLRPGTFAFVRVVPGGDKLGHFCLFGLVSFFVTAAMPASRRMVWGPLSVGLFVVVEELYQCWVPSRSFSLVDLSASLAGVVSAGIAATVMTRGDTPNVPTDADA